MSLSRRALYPLYVVTLAATAAAAIMLDLSALQILVLIPAAALGCVASMVRCERIQRLASSDATASRTLPSGESYLLDSYDGLIDIGSYDEADDLDAFISGNH